MIEARIAEIDATLSRQLNPILHHGEFQRLEATWPACATWSTRVRRANC